MKRNSRCRCLGALLFLGLCFSGSACATGRVHGQTDLLAATAVGEARCTDAAKQQLKPFLVEWDATDRAQFEALAARNLVFVRYEGCSLTVLDGCADDAVPGRYGLYRPPIFTSGASEHVEVRNEDELYANLPLGAASFGGNVRRGEALDLTYYVSGVASATRSSVGEGDLAGNPACVEATHFVYQYHLGAFSLDVQSEAKAKLGASFKEAGAGAKSSHEQGSLKTGGKLDDCTDTHQQISCRTPIRVVLRPLNQAGPSYPDAAAPGAPVAMAPPEETPAELANALRNSARDKERLGDGAGCLKDFTQADAMDAEGAANHGWLFVKAYCHMISGDCEKGKALFREFLIVTDHNKELSDENIARQVESTADAKCPSSTGTTPEERATRAIVTIAHAAARRPSSAETCIAEVKANEDLMVPRTDQSPEPGGPDILARAADCLVRAGRCDEARELWNRYYLLNWPDLPVAEREEYAATTFNGLKCRPK